MMSKSTLLLTFTIRFFLDLALLLLNRQGVPIVLLLIHTNKPLF